MSEFDGVKDIETPEDVIKMLEWYSKLKRGSLTAVHASKYVIVPNESNISFEPHELKFYEDKIKGCMSMQDINKGSQIGNYQG